MKYGVCSDAASATGEEAEQLWEHCLAQSFSEAERKRYTERRWANAVSEEQYAAAKAFLGRYAAALKDINEAIRLANQGVYTRRFVPDLQHAKALYEAGKPYTPPK